MAIDIILKDRNGKDVVYEGIETVTFDTPDEDVQATFSLGTVVDGVTIELDFSSDEDQVVSVPEGALVKQATIVKPADLLPENIRVGIDIGGVVGEYITPGTSKEVSLNFADCILANTPDEMSAILTSRENIGKFVKYTGETGEYVSGQYYKVIDEYEAFDPDSCSATATEITSGTTLTATLEGCKVGDLVVAAFAIRSALVSLSDGWTLISTSQSASEANPCCSTYQTLSFAYKYAASTTEELTVTQTTAGRIYINMVSLSGAVGCTDAGYQYQDNTFLDDAASVTIDRPEGGLILWGATRVNWKANNVWVPSNDATVVQSTVSTSPRLLVALDTSEEEIVTFASGNNNYTDAYICGALSIELEQAMYLVEADSSKVPFSDVKLLDADGDERWNNVTINKPETLLPENIAQGVNIGGVVGAHKYGDCFITYMSEDGSEVLYVKPVMYGDTCGDALALGLFDAPTKETDELEEYSFQGWATSIGGEVDSTVFDAVTEDRTVYAVFAPVPTVASGTFSGGAKWSLNENGTFFVYGEGAMDDYTSSTTNNRPWGAHTKNIKTVKIKNGVTHVSEFGFYNCAYITKVYISGSVTSIGKNAFYACTGLSDIIIPDGVISIADCAFLNCVALVRVRISGSVTSIGKNAFSACSNLAVAIFEDADTWCVGASAGETTTQVDVANVGTAATYLRTTHVAKYWTKV